MPSGALNFTNGKKHPLFPFPQPSDIIIHRAQKIRKVFKNANFLSILKMALLEINLMGI